MEIIKYHIFGQNLLLAADEQGLWLSDWENSPKITSHLKLSQILSPPNEVITQLNEYLIGERQDFSIPVHLIGTEFQQRVWKELQKIPYGETITYKELAQKIGYPKSVRAVANAVAHNRLSLFIPCHRVVACNEIGNYAGGKEMKIKLLELEQKNHR